MNDRVVSSPAYEKEEEKLLNEDVGILFISDVGEDGRGGLFTKVRVGRNKDQN